MFGLEDIDAAMQRDPALTSRLDALINAPGLHALWAHRLSHRLWRLGGAARLPARALATAARSVTGVEIHPGAHIGRRCYIDHGMGVVIGETAVVGDDVLLYHGATLGGRTSDTGRRHPTIGNRVMIGAGACIIGDVTIGDDAQVGANAVVIRDVPARTTAVGVAARLLQRDDG